LTLLGPRTACLLFLLVNVALTVSACKCWGAVCPDTAVDEEIEDAGKRCTSERRVYLGLKTSANYIREFAIIQY